MGILADFEDRIGNAIEGTFGGIFRSHVQPAEIARMCAKEMDRSKKLGVGKVYVANFYHIILSPRDGDALGGLTTVLKTELETYLLAHARENNYQLPTHPCVVFVTDSELRLGKFDIIGETMSQAEIDHELGLDEVPVPVPPIPVAMPVASPAPSVPDVTVASEPKPATHALSGDGEAQVGFARLVSPMLGSIALDDQDRYTIGRKETCDIRLDDSAASRVHATLTYDGRAWIIRDNDSTNSTQINGHVITSRRLKNGDVITIGTTQLTYRNDKASVPKIPPLIEGEAPSVGERDLIRDLL